MQKGSTCGGGDAEPNVASNPHRTVTALTTAPATKNAIQAVVGWRAAASQSRTMGTFLCRMYMELLPVPLLNSPFV